MSCGEEYLFVLIIHQFRWVAVPLAVLAIAVSWASATPLWAQANKRPIYPKGFEVTTDWQYSCPEGKGCSFNCPGSGGANNVTSLSIFLGSVPIGKKENSAGIFYEFTSTQTLRGSGFLALDAIAIASAQRSLETAAKAFL